MNVQLEIENDDTKEIINIDNVDDLKHFDYVDSYGANNELTLLDKGIDIKRIADTHSTHLLLKENENSFVEINSLEGTLKIEAKVLAFDTNHDIITLVYKVNDRNNSITIRKYGS